MFGKLSVLTTVLSVTLCLALLLRADEPPRYAGQTGKGFLLPNGWTISPAGEQVTLTDLPLNIVPLADGRHAITATSGFNTHNLSLIDLTEKRVVANEIARQSWFGLAVNAKSGQIWWSGGGGDRLHAFMLKENKLIRTSQPETFPVKKAAPGTSKHFRSGVTLDTTRSVVYTLDMEAGTITTLDPSGKDAPRTARAGKRPYDVAVARNGSRLYVSDWANRLVLTLDPADLRVVAKIPVGEHPNQIAVHPKDDRIFVANASSNSVSVIDTNRGVVIETIVTALFPLAPGGEHARCSRHFSRRGDPLCRERR